MNNNANSTSQKKYVLDTVALVISIISVFTCSSCFMLGIAGLILSLIVILDGKGKYNKTKGVISLILSIVSLLLMIVLMVFLGKTDTNKNDDDSDNISTSVTTTSEAPTLPVTDTSFDEELSIFNGGEYKYIKNADLAKYSPNMAGEKVYIVAEAGNISESDVHCRIDDSLMMKTFNTPSRNYSGIIKENEQVAVLGIVGEFTKDILGYSVEFNDCMVFACGAEAQKYKKEESDDYFEQFFYVSENVVRYVGSDEVSSTEFKSACKAYDYTDILRNPDNYKKSCCSITGTVGQIIEGWFDTFTFYIEDINGNRWECSYSYESGESHLLEGDSVTVYGILDGTTTATTLLGEQVTMPDVEIKYIE